MRGGQVHAALAVAVLALLLSLATLAYASVRNHERTREIEQARREAKRTACLLENEQAVTIRAFVMDVAPHLRVRVATAFPVEACR